MENKNQKRHAERVANEAKQVYTNLTARFLEFFIYSDEPHEQKIIDKMEEINIKWTIYCDRKKLNKEAYPIVKDYMDGVIKQYSEKANGIPA